MSTKGTQHTRVFLKKLEEYYSEYLITGGMHASINSWIDYHDIEAVDAMLVDNFVLTELVANRVFTPFTLCFLKSSTIAEIDYPRRTNLKQFPLKSNPERITVQKAFLNTENLINQKI